MSALCNIAAAVPARAAERPHGLAVVCPEGRNRASRVRYTHYTFGQLDAESDNLARGLQSLGIQRGTRTVLMVKPSLEFFALTFGLFKVGAVPVMVDPGMGVRNLGRCLAEAEPEAFIGIPKAHVARLLFGWARRSLRVLVGVGMSWLPGGYTLAQVRGRAAPRLTARQEPRPPVFAATQADDVAAILFTSGSTGVPKGAVYTHGIFAKQVELLRETYGIEPGEIDLCTFPLFALFAPALGMTAVVPEMDATRPGHVDPRRIIEPVEDFGVTNLFGSPALLSRVGSYCEMHGVQFPTLRRVIAAGAPVSFRILECWEKLLAPGVQVFTPYGATEALPVCSIGSQEILAETAQRTAEGAGVCVGRPVHFNQVAIIGITDDPIPEWTDDLLTPTDKIGEIVVQGPIVTRVYFRRPDLTARAKIADPSSGTFYHRMGDVGYLDERGRLWFCGRKAHRVQTPAGTLFTIPCEAVFNNHPRVARTALVGVGPPDKQRPVLCVELKESELRGDWPSLEAELRELGAAQPHTKTIGTFLLYPRAFPVDIRHNAKIFREQLALWAARKLK